ncbi:MAG: glycoside hydrolase family 24 [Oscillatoriales cyanobacterium]|nr:MAG: glycoside hydrolase family 24 [Oscillatoriales cyanobacterium]
MYASEHLGSHLLRMSDQELIRLWVNRKSTPSKPLAEVTLTDVQTFAAAMRVRRVPPRFYKQTLLAVKSLFAFGQQTGILPAVIPLYAWPVRQRSKQSKRLRLKLGWSLCICLCFFLGRITPKLWSQTVSAEISPPPKRLTASAESSPASASEALPKVATDDPPDKGKNNENQEDNIERDRVKAFLDTIATAEGTAGSDGYRTQYTGTKFASFSDHPREMRCGRRYGKKLCSDAAGRYQFLSTTWDRFAKKFSITDFSPQNQDFVAVELIREKDALEDIEAGRLEPAIRKLAYIWPSFRRFGGSVDSSLPKLEAMYEKNLGIYRQGLAVNN